MKSTEVPALDLTGELALSTAAEVLAAARHVTFAAGELALDGSGITRIDLAGLQLLVSATKSAAAAGCSLRIENPSSALHDALQRAGLRL